MFKRVIPIIALAGAAGLVLAGCASGDGDASGSTDQKIAVPGAGAAANSFMNRLYEKAVDSGKTDVVIYGGSPSSFKGVWDAFADRFRGLTVRPQDMSNGQSLTKLKLEASSGKRIADIVSAGHSGIEPVANEPNICVEKPTIKTAPEKDLTRYFDDKVVITTNQVFGVVYNTDMVKEKDVPTSWTDLLKPRWKGGKIAMYDPTALGGTRFIFGDMQIPGSPMEDTAGKIISGIAAQKPHITSQEPTVASDVAAGRFPLGIGVYKGFYDSVKEQSPDAPIGFHFPWKEGNELIYSGSCQIKDAPDADAALLLTNWMFTKEGQRAIVEKTGSYAALPDAAGPEGMPPLGEVTRFPELKGPQSEYDPYFAVIDKYFKG